LQLNRAAKVELNHRSQACEVLTGAGGRLAKTKSQGNETPTD